MRFVLVICLILPIRISLTDIQGCDYFDTVDLRRATRLPNDSYQYEKVIIPPEETAIYDYEILANGERASVAPHLRGCACKFGNCVRFCCDKNHVLVPNERRCEKVTDAILDYDPYLDITLSNGSVVTRHVLNEMVVQQDLGVPCALHIHLDAENDESYKWSLFENGTLYRHFDGKYMGKQDYCLQPHEISHPNSTNDFVYTLVPHNCLDPPEDQTIFHILRILSIICMLITIFVYLWIKKLRNLHGYCFVCYMICLIIAYALLIADGYVSGWTRTTCKLNGYFGYFFVIAGFCWLTVISYDLWCSFRPNRYNVSRYAFKTRFGIYSAYAWGVPLLLTIVICVIDHSLDRDNPDHVAWLPGVALYNCWVKTNDWSAMLYFHGIMAIQIAFNLTMFALTALSIIAVKKELQSLSTQNEREKRVRADSQTFNMFVRLFVIMGITWTFEIFAYLAQDNKTIMKWLVVFDYINCAQGIIIFVLFVLKKSVLKLISDRIRGVESTDEDCSEEEIALQDTNGVNKNIGPNILH